MTLDDWSGMSEPRLHRGGAKGNMVRRHELPT